MTVAAILKHKGHDVVHVGPDATIAEVAQQFAVRGIGAILVCDAWGDLLGIISERDVVRSLAAHGAVTLGKRASELMTRDVTTVTERTTVPEAMEMMTLGRFRHLPVMQDGRITGIVSIGDIVKARMMQQEQEVDSLKAYVAGAA